MSVLFSRKQKLLFLSLLWFAVFAMVFALSCLLDFIEPAVQLGFVIRTAITTAIVVLTLNLFLVPKLQIWCSRR